MPVFTESDLQRWSDGQWIGPRPDSVYGFGIDTRVLTPGDCFVALRTDKRDGHAFLADAARAGAAAAIVSHPQPDVDLPQLLVSDTLAAFHQIAAAHRDTFHGRIVAITGSCGKTSTKDLLTLLLGGDAVLKTEGNLNNYLGVPLTLLRLDNELHRIAVIEAGINEPGEMRQLAAMIRPDLAIVTMVGAAHLEKLHTLERVAEEKAALPRITLPQGQVLFPASCLRYAAFRALDEAPERCFVPHPADDEAPPGAPGMHFVPYFTDDTTESDNNRPSAVSGCPVIIGQPPAFKGKWLLPPVSEGMRQNAVLAILAARLLHRDRNQIQRGLDRWRPALHRGEVRTVGGKTFFLDCYNANPSSLSDALRHFVHRFSEAPRLFVLGGMRELGTLSEEMHRQAVGVLSPDPQDRFILVGSEARGYKAGLTENGVQSDQITAVEDVMDALDQVRAFEGPVFVKGSRTFRLERVCTELSPAAAADRSGRQASC